MIHVIAINATPAEAPAEIVFLPEGEHRLTPKSHPGGIAVNLPAAQGEAIAAAFNRDLAKRGNVGGWFDFEHTRKFPVSAYPTGFRYKRGVGIMAAVEWSESGRKAVEGRDVRYFSPEFYIDKNGVPTGLPERGPLGGLVTEPAFREIPAIAAAQDITADQLIAAGEWLAEQVKDAFETRIDAALSSARATLPPGADFTLVWASAVETDPAAFGEADNRPAPVQRINAAQERARAVVGSDAPFTEVWSVAASLDPNAFL